MSSSELSPSETRPRRGAAGGALLVALTRPAERHPVENPTILIFIGARCRRAEWAAARAVARATGPVDLVLSDIVMPVLNGGELGDRLAAERPELRVLFMSGYTDDDIVRRGLLRPGSPFLQKPFMPAELARKVREVLDGR